ncbi:MAG: divalent-cation tolerance protein CutA [Paracoccaceae bacterium]|nr:divalent-cation tolerance protein CutA [Paracoccaceae bacterium]
MPLTVYTTLPDEASAKALARSAVTQKLAACVQIERITSVYEWDGVQEDAEFRVLFKTSQAAYDALAEHILQNHPYDEPALWAHKIDSGSASYLAWIDETATG